MANEADTCRQYVLPKLTSVGWTDEQIREQYSFTDGRILVQGRQAARAKLPQGAPSGLATDVATETSADPGCDRSPTPVVNSWMGFGERLAQRCLLLLGEQRLTCSPRTALVAHAVGSSRVVATRDLADPVGGISGEAGNGFGGEATRQEPEEVPAAALDWILGSAVPSSQFI
jgi:hypothetical protein